MPTGFRSLPPHRQDMVIVGLSLVLAVSPWLLGYYDLGVARWDAVFVAPILALGALAVILRPAYWPDFVVAFFAFWLLLSPRILAFTDRLMPTIVDVVIGISVIVLAFWSAIRRSRELRGMAKVVDLAPPTDPTQPPHGRQKAA